MDITAITPEFSVAPAMTPEGVAQAAARGYRALVGAAPDVERDGPSDSEILRSHAETHGLAFSHTPVVVGLIGRDDVEAFRDAISRADGPVLAYCHSGLRAALLWALANRDELGDEVVIAAAGKAGFDIAAYLDEDGDALKAA